MNKMLSLAVCALFLLASCSKSKGPAPVNNPIWPMKVGNQWTYINVNYLSGGSVHDSSILTYNINTTHSYHGYQFYSLTDGTNYYYYRNATDSTIWNADVNGVITVYYTQVDTTKKFVDTAQDFSDNSAAIVHGRLKSTAYADSMAVDGYVCHKVEQLLTDTAGNVMFKTDIYMSRGIGIIRRSYYKLDADNNLYLYNQADLRSYNFD